MTLHSRIKLRAALAAALLALAFGPAATAQDKQLGWADTAELGLIATSGNTESITLGFKNKLWWVGERSGFELNAGGIRTRTITERIAIGDPNGNYTVDFDIEEEKNVTAENYYLNARYDREISKKFFWFTGAGWDKNEFAGIDSRYTGFGGVGNIWIDREDHKFRTDYSATYTKQNDVVENEDFDDTFGGFRLSWAYLKAFAGNTTYTNDFVFNSNIEDSEDWRGDMINAVAVSLQKGLALKVSYQVLYDNLPSFEEIDIYDARPDDGGTKFDTVLSELDEFDTIFTATLVINF